VHFALPLKQAPNLNWENFSARLVIFCYCCKYR